MTHALTTSNFEIHSPQSVGYLALDTLQASVNATVMGVTSRGLFLRSSSRWLTFLSYESYRSPLTIALGSFSSGLQQVEVNTTVLVGSGLLVFPAVAVAVRLLDNRTWCPATPAGEIRSFSKRLRELRAALGHMKWSYGDRGFGPLLRGLLAAPAETDLAGTHRQTLELIFKLQEAIRCQELPPTLDAAQRLLGLGPGLTPSGDDFLIGLLLVLNRWAEIHPHGRFLQALNGALVETAYRKTTTLSANLIECATHGEADERLLAMADGIVTGVPPATSWLTPLSGWGASSRIDVLCGAVVAIQLSANSN